MFEKNQKTNANHWKMERWMKEKASKSFGGPCMSKFVRDHEQKRLDRLKKIKSSIKTSAQKHDPWTQTKMDKRHRDLMQQRRSKMNERNPEVCPEIKFLTRSCETETTRCGLKLKLSKGKRGHGHSQPRDEVSLGSRDNSEKPGASSLTNPCTGGDKGRYFPCEGEGKENQSYHEVKHVKLQDSSVVLAVEKQMGSQFNRASVRDKSQVHQHVATFERLKKYHQNGITVKGRHGADDSNIIEKERKDSLLKIPIQEEKETNMKAPPHDYNYQSRKSTNMLEKKKSRKNTRQKIESKDKMNGEDKRLMIKVKHNDTKTMKIERHKTKKKQLANKTNNKPYLRPGISMQSLYKEHEDALKILKELDEGEVTIGSVQELAQSVGITVIDTCSTTSGLFKTENTTYRDKRVINDKFRFHDDDVKNIAGDEDRNRPSAKVDGHILFSEGNLHHNSQTMTAHEDDTPHEHTRNACKNSYKKDEPEVMNCSEKCVLDVITRDSACRYSATSDCPAEMMDPLGKTFNAIEPIKIAHDICQSESDGGSYSDNFDSSSVDEGGAETFDIHLKTNETTNCIPEISNVSSNQLVDTFFVPSEP